MAKCHRSNVDSLVLDHRHHAKNTTADNFCISASSIRRIIFDAVSCGGTSRHRHRHRDELHNDIRYASVSHKEKRHVEEEKHEKLLDLLNVPVHATDAESKKKEEMLLELKRVVKELREEDSTKRRMAAARVRLLTKDDAEARVSLAMLGAISPLVGMLDSEDVHSQIDSLYALLNIGIGNDA